MRTALLAAVKRTDAGRLRAELELGGRSVLAWQVELVRALGCERIVCLCEVPGGEVLALQKEVEAAGGAFHAIRSNIQLASLVRADDELVMILDGLVADRAIVIAQTGFHEEAGGLLAKGIATIPANHPLAAQHPEDFERIDRDRNWAGLAVMRASQVHKIADLPPDSEAMSLLLRLGLQARVEGREVSPEALDSGRWMLASDQGALVTRELALIESSARVPAWTGPGRAIAATFVHRIAPRWLRKGAEISALIALVLILSGLALTAFGMAPWGLGLAALGAFANAMSEAWSTLRAALWGAEVQGGIARFSTLATDALAAAALVLANTGSAPDIASATMPILAFGLARILGGETQASLASFWRDRTLHLAIFAIAAGFGVLEEALALFALGALVQLLLRKRTD